MRWPRPRRLLKNKPPLVKNAHSSCVCAFGRSRRSVRMRIKHVHLISESCRIDVHNFHDSLYLLHTKRWRPWREIRLRSGQSDVIRPSRHSQSFYNLELAVATNDNCWFKTLVSILSVYYMTLFYQTYEHIFSMIQEANQVLSPQRAAILLTHPLLMPLTSLRPVWYLVFSADIPKMQYHLPILWNF